MIRTELIEQFSAAYQQGWRVDPEDFPEEILGDFFPAPQNIFKALELFSPHEVMFLILGKDPYRSQIATGIAFEANNNNARALRIIINHVYPNNGQPPSLNERLHQWSTERQILLLNAALTIPINNGDHLTLWSRFTKSIITQLRQQNPNIQLLAWGKPARKLMCDALENAGVFTSCPHPSSRGAAYQEFRNFWGSPIGVALRMQPEQQH